MIKKEKQFSELISTLSAILDLDENIKLYHAWRTALVAYYLALDIVPADAVQIFFAGLLHDVGAVGLEDHIVHYPESSYRDKAVIMNHPVLGAAIVREIPGMEKVSQYILDHHESIDGEGYPAGKKGDEISIQSQILYVADHLDLLLRVETMDKTDIYNSFRVRKNRKFSAVIWPAFLNLLNYNSGTFFHMLKDKSGYMQLMHDVLEKVSQVDLALPGDFLDRVVKVFGRVIDAKHSYTQGHTERVVRYSTIIGQALGLTAEEIQHLQRGGYLHDIGKLGVPLSILDKKEPLTDDEFHKIRRHIIITMEVLDSMSFLQSLTEISGYHHARWDGKGYPDRIGGTEIPLGARILCIGDSFDAMTSNRAYRKAFDFEYAWEELKKNANTQFDPDLIALLDKPGVRASFEQVYQEEKARSWTQDPA